MGISNTAVPKEYAAFKESVLRGEIPVNRLVSLEMNRIDFLISSPDYYYDSQAIDGFIRYCEEEMTLTDGGDLKLLPSFRLWAEQALAWFYIVDERYFDADSRRWMYRKKFKRLTVKQYLIVGRGAAKSLYGSCIMSYMLTIDPASTNQIVTSPTMRQSDEIIGPIRTAIARAKGPLFKYMTEGSKLANQMNQKQLLSSTKKGIENFATNSLIEVRPMTVDKLQGSRAKYAVVDEWLSGDTREDVIGAIEQGASKNSEYLILATSSEGTKRGGVGDSIKMELLNILEGRYFNPRVSIWYYRLDDIREVADPIMWLKANPNLGTTVTFETYQEEVERAENNPSTRSDTLAKRFGIPVEGYTRFFLYEETLLHSHQNYDGLECAMGADLSQGDDFCAFTFLFPLGYDRFGIKAIAYITDIKYRKQSPATRLKYDELISEGTLIMMNSSILNMEDVFAHLSDHIYQHQYNVLVMGYDPYNADNFVSNWKSSYGEYGVEKVRQGAITQSVPMGQIKGLASQRLLIFDQELMKFTMGNAISIQDNNGNMKLSKERQADKIDNVSALINAWVVYNKYPDVFG